MVDFGHRLKELRRGQGITQRQLADALYVSKSMISSFESSTRLPSHQVLMRIRNYFNVSMDFLYGYPKAIGLDVTGLSQTQTELLRGLVGEFRRGDAAT
jgi:transcriptional regulator with XRE-family HTH domain